VNKNSTGQDRASRARGGKRHSFSPVAPVCYRPPRLCNYC
jgi:hypothetical protein